MWDWPLIDTELVQTDVRQAAPGRWDQSARLVLNVTFPYFVRGQNR